MKKKKIDYGEFNYELDNPSTDVCSSTECTGAMPRPPQSEEELDAYEEVVHFDPPRKK